MAGEVWWHGRVYDLGDEGAADGSSVPFSDLVPCDIVYPERIGEIYELKHNPKHDWHYFSEMGRDEIILIKGYDSNTDGTVRFAPHSAFNHPDSKPSDPIRVSIEVRTIARTIAVI